VSVVTEKVGDIGAAISREPRLGCISIVLEIFVDLDRVNVARTGFDNLHVSGSHIEIQSTAGCACFESRSFIRSF
jgi:hypothetical protein